MTSFSILFMDMWLNGCINEHHLNWLNSFFFLSALFRIMAKLSCIQISIVLFCFDAYLMGIKSYCANICMHVDVVVIRSPMGLYAWLTYIYIGHREHTIDEHFNFHGLYTNARINLSLSIQCTSYQMYRCRPEWTSCKKCWYIAW